MTTGTVFSGYHSVVVNTNSQKCDSMHKSTRPGQDQARKNKSHNGKRRWAQSPNLSREAIKNQWMLVEGKSVISKDTAPEKLFML